MSIVKTLITISPNGTRHIVNYDHEPGLRVMQSAVGGLIERVPNFEQYGINSCIAYVNEEGISMGLILNEPATALWKEQLGEGPFRYEPVILGNLLIEINGVYRE